jgi:hypothetical protein
MEAMAILLMDTAVVVAAIHLTTMDIIPAQPMAGDPLNIIPMEQPIPTTDTTATTSTGIKTTGTTKAVITAAHLQVRTIIIKMAIDMGIFPEGCEIMLKQNRQLTPLGQAFFRDQQRNEHIGKGAERPCYACKKPGCDVRYVTYHDQANRYLVKPKTKD